MPTPMPAFETEGGKKDAGADAGSSARSTRLHNTPIPVVPKRRAITVRVVGFLALLVALIGGAGLAVAWYARGTYFVALNNDELTIYRGRPGGLLWFQPTVVRPNVARIDDVPAASVAVLRAGKEESSLNGALAYVDNLKSARRAQESTTATTTTTTTTVPAPTTTIAAGGTVTTS
jgi:protein phosphatase